MCLGIPGTIVEIWDEPSGARMAHVEFPTDSGSGTEVRKLCMAFLPQLQIGDYTIAHAGFALTKIERESAMVTLATMAEYGVLGAQPEAAS